MYKLYRFILLSLLLASFSILSLAQDNNVIVPDVTGLPVPQAAAILNEAGLNLGTQTAASEATGANPNTVVSQSMTAGSSAAYGTAIDLTVVLPPNTRLLYDDNDITVVNLTDQVTDTSGLIFTSTEGTSATYAASQWDSSLRERQCFQLWSVNRNGPKGIDDCEFIQLWRTTNNTSAHFWTQVNGVQQFAILENGVQRAVCPAAPPNSQDNVLTCEFYLAGGASTSDTTDFLYFIYSRDAIALINSSEARWMPTAQNTIYNYNPQIAIPGSAGFFGDSATLREEHRVGLGSISQLAPQQCIMYTLTGSSLSEAPEACNLIAYRSLDAEVAFWLANFEVESVLDGVRRICPAAHAERLTRCIIRR